MTFRTIWSVLRRVPEFARLPFHSASSFRRNLQSEMEGEFCGTKLAFTTIQTLMVNANADAWLQKMKLVRWESVISATFPREGKGLVSLKFLNKWINDTERVHASVVIFTFNNLTQERQGSRLLGWKSQSRTSISKRAPPMFSGGSKVVKLLVPYLSESCTQKGSYEKNSIKFPSSEWNFPNFVTSSENYTSLLMHVVVHPLSLYGVPEQLPREPWRRRWTGLRLQCHCMSTEGDGGMWVDSHWLGRKYGAAMMCRECAEGMGTSIGMEGVWVAYTCCMAVYCAPCHCPVVGWWSVWVGTEGLPRLFVLFVNRGVCPVPPAWSVSHSLQSSSPILGCSSCRIWACLWFLDFQFLIQSWQNSSANHQFIIFIWAAQGKLRNIIYWISREKA